MISFSAGVLTLQNYQNLDMSIWNNTKIKLTITSTYFNDVVDLHVVTLFF